MIGSNYDRMKTILITGINGFLGSNLAKKLSLNYSIIGLEYSLENLYRLEGYDFRIYESRNCSLDEIFRENKIDIVIHTATVYRNDNSSIENLFETNIMVPVRLFEISQLSGSGTFINTDSFFNDPNHQYSYLGEYTLSKRHCIEWLKTLQKGGMKLINMKLFHMFGPADSPGKFVMKLISELKSNKAEIQLTEGLQKRDFVFIDDVVEAYSVVIDKIDQIDNNYAEFQVGTGQAITLRKFVETASKVVNSKSNLSFGSLKYRAGEIMFSQADISKLHDLNWDPKYSLEHSIYETANSRE
jgi:CDP-paratose synthetase